MTAVRGLWHLCLVSTLRVKQFFFATVKAKSFTPIFVAGFPQRIMFFKIPLPNPAGSPVPWSQGWNRTELHGFIDWIFHVTNSRRNKFNALLIQQPHFKDNDL